MFFFDLECFRRSLLRAAGMVISGRLLPQNALGFFFERASSTARQRRIQLAGHRSWKPLLKELHYRLYGGLCLIVIAGIRGGNAPGPTVPYWIRQRARSRRARPEPGRCPYEWHLLVYDGWLTRSSSSSSARFPSIDIRSRNGFASPPYFIQMEIHEFCSCGFPHSEICGSTDACS
jgi:hypothetical protein